MTTQELKQQIDKVLGNSIRCLLPSYWWKRLFNQVADRIEEVEQSTSQLIDSKVEEVKMPIVESVDALEKLEAELGDIATIGYDNLKSINISQCPLAEELDVIGAWDNLTHVNKIEQGVPYNNGSDYLGIYFSTKSEFGTDVIIVGSSEGKCGYYYWYNNSDERVITLEETNKLLKEKEYRVVSYNINIDGSIIDQTFKLYAGFTTADAYIKGDSWERLAKESDVTEEPIIFILFADTEEGKALNAKAYQQYIDDNSECPNVAINVIFGCPTVVTSMRPISNASEHQYITLIWCDFGGNIRETHIHSDGSVSSVEESHFDSELSDTSENAVQNKAIKAYVDEQVAKAGGGSLSINELDITSPAQIQGIIAKVREGEHDIYWVGSDTQSSSCLSYYIYDDLSLFVVTDDLCMSIFDLQGNKIIVDTKYRIYGLGGASTSNSKRVDKNSVMYRMIADGLISGTDCYLHYADNGKDYKVSQCEMTTVGSTTYLCLSAVADGTIIKLRMLNSGKYYDSTTEPLISFDSELSDTSINAVQNKVLTEALGILEEHVDNAIANAITNTLNTEV